MSIHMPVDLKMPTANIVQYIYRTQGGNIEEVAEILGCDVATIEKIEAGKEQYKKQQISKILEFYKVDRLEPPTRFSDGEVERILSLWR
ncbi:MAG: helix-turn-helix transcriptional regulator, partial [Defluviitaleaceae bacterium]|nr:helix-turn-helix transcriptional regulator [Defluviitaleaceae bacterium]